MYGVTQAGERGWGDVGAIGASVLGLASLAAFVLWEANLTRRPGGEPLIDVALFRSRSFSAGIVLAAVGIFGLFGVIFALPQYLQAIAGLDAQGAGLRFLPAIGGMAAGAIPADRFASRLGPKLAVAIGFVIVAAGLFAGSGMSASSGDGFIAAWTFVVGFGAGMGLATSASLAIVELSAERSGVGSALFQAVIKLGPAFGATILGSVLNATYQAGVNVVGLPADAAAAVQKSVFSGIVVAQQLESPALLASVQTAFVAGIDDAIRTAAIVAAAAVVLALAVLPRRVRSASGTATRRAVAEAAAPAAPVHDRRVTTGD